jgi:hypothetical protein
MGSEILGSGVYFGIGLLDIRGGVTKSFDAGTKFVQTKAVHVWGCINFANGFGYVVVVVL